MEQVPAAFCSGPDFAGEGSGSVAGNRRGAFANRVAPVAGILVLVGSSQEIARR